MAEKDEVHKLEEADKILKQYGFDLSDDEKDDFYMYFGSFAGEDVVVDSQELEEALIFDSAFSFLIQGIDPTKNMKKYRKKKVEKRNRRRDV